ncbi:TonB-dependent receptor [Hyphococcus flavus]|uniref:TonB-dependent receptor n=1 Tax=Hyphococcus flavus TaxID=1866326 RepID=A0AAE9ZEF2_9PROT|nr:TonB-dependent receptor [Hyphococcus flavus]WDI32225.1 TonB-dependent receptor [Hyphococcus flavus]
MILCISRAGANISRSSREAYLLQKTKRRTSRSVLLNTACVAFISFTGAHAQETEQSVCPDGAQTCTVNGRVIYLPGYFSQFNPITALDMVQRVPGFSIDAGDQVRGFGGAAGNVLIDGQRPSTKSADIFEILGRIGAGNIEHIELIRGGTGGLDVGGQSVVVNVVQKQGAGSSTPSPWEFYILKRRPDGGVTPGGEISYIGRIGGLKYTLGANGFAARLRYGGDEQITRFFGDDELRQRRGQYKEKGVGGNLNLEYALANGDIAHLNIEGDWFDSLEETTETRFPAMDGPDIAFFPFDYEEYGFEVGGDYEHNITDSFSIKLIGLYEREFENFESRFEFTPAAGTPVQSLFISDRDIGETIGRVEFGFNGLDRHNIQFGGEIAKNFIESAVEFFVDDGSGVLTPQVINGANTRVSELRGEPFAKDSWTLSEKATLDIGMAVELSSISQSGDSENARFFVYPKPSLALAYSFTPQTQVRFNAERRVNQLDFDEFVSSVNFDDEDVDFGNPDLQPQRTWAFETSFEQRFGDIGVIKLSGFYNYVNDVEDLLPIGGGAEVPGNIGDGEVWGGEIALTAPLDFLGLKNARLETTGMMQESSVTDPVTGVDREFSFISPYSIDVDFRQDFPERKFSWGWGLYKSGKETNFGLDEITTFSFPKPELDAFIETTAIKGVKVRLAAGDILNVNVKRDRTVFDMTRASGVALFREMRGNQNGGNVRLTFSGTF